VDFSRAIFLIERIGNETAWQQPDDAALEPLRTRLKALSASFGKLRTPTEPQTEKELIRPLVETLGWSDMRTICDLRSRRLLCAESGRLHALAV
jgi:hypothetical protein